MIAFLFVGKHRLGASIMAQNKSFVGEKWWPDFYLWEIYGPGISSVGQGMW